MAINTANQRIDNSISFRSGHVSCNYAEYDDIATLGAGVVVE
jgi:hypothetical protein